MQEQKFTIYPLGDSALILDFGNRIDEGVNQKVIGITRAVHEESIFGVQDIVPAYSSITIHYDPVKVILHNPATSAYATIKRSIKVLLEKQQERVFPPPLRTSIPVCYTPAFGPDIRDVASFATASVAEVIRLHTAKIYRVYMIGFLPGFAYMGEVDEQIAMPRKRQPRQQIPAGSVGIAGKQTGIYPLTSPGGWQIIGRTPVLLFDPGKTNPVLLKAGDEVVFFSITEDEFNHY